VLAVIYVAGVLCAHRRIINKNEGFWVGLHLMLKPCSNLKLSH
jgi:hypothetical protein